MKGEPQVADDLIDNLRLFDEGDDTHLATGQTYQKHSRMTILAPVDQARTLSSAAGYEICYGKKER